MIVENVRINLSGSKEIENGLNRLEEEINGMGMIDVGSGKDIKIVAEIYGLTKAIGFSNMDLLSRLARLNQRCLEKSGKGYNVSNPWGRMVNQNRMERSY